MDDQRAPEIDVSRKPASGGSGTGKVVGGIGAVILAALAGLARHADDLGRGIFRHADDLGSGASHFTDEIGRGAARFGDDLGGAARFGDDLGPVSRVGEDATKSLSRFGQEMEGGAGRFGDDVSGIKADFSDGLQRDSPSQHIGELVPSSARPDPVRAPTTASSSKLSPSPEESSGSMGARILLRGGEAAARHSTDERDRDGR